MSGSEVARVGDLGPAEMARAIMDLAQKMTPEHIGSLKPLTDMLERIEAREAQRQYVTAFQELQHDLPIIRKNGTLEYPINKNDPDGPKRKISSFAKWEDVQAELEPLLWKHGFTLTFDNELTAAGALVVIAILTHIGGHVTRTKSPPLPCDSSGGKNNLQGWGSSGSYGCRYATRAALNLKFEGEDDDGVRGGKQFVTDEQIAELRALVEETKTDEARMLATLTSEALSLGEIEAKDFARIKNALLAKRKR